MNAIDTAPAMTTSTTCAIRAEDFSNRVTDASRDRWHAGSMRHLIAALDGQPVIVTTDKMTGHSLVGVVLESVEGTRGGSGYSVVIRSTYEDGTVKRVAHPLFVLGSTIIPIGESRSGSDGKWKALRTYGDEGSAAIRLAQAEHGESEGRAWGSWRASIGYGSVGVTYEPSTGNPHFADKAGEGGYWSYKLSAL